MFVVRGRSAMLCVALLACGAAVASHQSLLALTQSGQATENEWLTDAQGRQYRLERLPRAQGVKIGTDKVRTMWGVVADLGREDDEAYYLKLYRVDAVAPPPAVAPPSAVSHDVLPTKVSRLTFEPFGTGLPQGGQWREGLVVGDVTGDGRPDIVAGPARKTLRAPSVFSLHDGKWSRAAVAFPARPYDYGTLAFAAPRAGEPAMLALGVHLRGLMALRHVPGGFTDASDGLPFVRAASDAVFSSRAVALGDCNADGRIDLIALGEGPRLGARGREASASTGLTTFVRDAAGRWSALEATAVPEVFGTRLSLGDVDGDGRPDVAIASGQFSDGRVLFRGDGRCGWTQEPLPIPERSFVTAVALSDLDGDGRSEVIVGITRFDGPRAWAQLDVHHRNREGTWRRTALSRLDGRVRFDAIATGDFDGDGRIDIAAAGPSGETTIFLGTRDGFVTDANPLVAPGGCTASALVARDLDGDGRAELVAAHAQERSTATAGACPSEGALTVWRANVPPAAPQRPTAD